MPDPITSPEGLVRSVDTLPLAQLTDTLSVAESDGTATLSVMVWP